MKDSLKLYKAKRNFAITPEPAEGGEEGTEALTFVIQKHWATRLHYDFRLELDGTMKSWAVPKGPSYDSHDKRMAVHVEDHPISYNDFEGVIPEKQYGAGKVIIWDKGTWHPIGDPRKGYRDGNLKFELRGHKMHGRWVLVRMRRSGEKQEPWLLIKENDEYVRAADEFSVVDEMPDSVKALGMPTGERLTPAADEAESTALAHQGKPARKKAAGSAAKGAATSTAKPAKSAKTAVAKPGAKAKMPATLSPELATLVDAPPPDPADWIFELKFDGYRLLARVEGGNIGLWTRNGNDWTHKLEPLRAAIEKMRLPDGWYDGEIVVHDQNGKPNFGLLQQAFDGSRTKNIVYFVFDAPYLDGHDLRDVPLAQRRELLKTVLDAKGNDTVRFSAELDAPPAEIVAAACRMGLEGIIGKRRDATYVSRRSGDWIKLKCALRQEFVIGGYTDPQGSRVGIGSLLLGYYDDAGKLHYAGNVGAGFNEKSLRDITAKLHKLASDTNPFAPTKAIEKKAHWVKPTLVAEVTFGEWTGSGSIRHSVFQGLRKDKKAASIRREQAAHVEDVMQTQSTTKAAPVRGKAKAKAKADPVAESDVGSKLPASLKVTNPDRLIDPASGMTKIGLVRYYALVADLMLEHLKGRPVALVRAPAGVGGELFFQKHSEVGKLPGVKQLPQELDPDHPTMLEVATTQGLLSCAQWNVVELHTQNAFARTYDKPNRMIFDLDPGQGVTWERIQEAAQLMRAFLEELGLPTFLKTSGGKGLHVVVPVKPQHDWDTVKGFSKLIVEHMARTLPDRFAFKSGPKNRVGKIFIDYLRNGRGATTVCAWSARTRPGLGISVPVAWDELPHLKGGDQWTVATVHTRLDHGNAPWADYAKSAVSITKAMKQMGYTGA
ncbi:bifunctional non-homologous end joining protein LigD [Pseudoduganella flava]|uniref:DNA ligase (ATP) n=1 Tax=Pseudoduganella flava TaxID=871742 RepID=A0A562PHD6_9BURK|nr:DNA ligase D [Pseudoduganella flava]QGZ42504.1 DNA ligase D [Pseudoduganella flava]TWI43650.1 bifunctional non-homologous end joining protein LigD [Pseudoduganella flava]